MSNTVLLFKSFNSELPDEFIKLLQSNYQEATILTTKNKMDFNRFDLALRFDPYLKSLVNSVSTVDMSKYIYFLKVADTETGLIECNVDGLETWKSKT